MNLDSLKQKAAAAKEFEETQKKGREKTDAGSDKKRGDFSVGQQQEQALGALEKLRESKQKIEGVKKQIESFIAQASELQGKKGQEQKKLFEIYDKINSMLKDQDIQTELKNLRKNITNAEQLIADPDFSEDAGVSDALKIQTTLAEIENQLVALEQDEKKLHTEVTGGNITNGSKDLSQIRQELAQTLEAQTRQLDEEIGVLELHTPEGQQKAEADLTNKLANKLELPAEIRSDVKEKGKLADITLSGSLVGDIYVAHFKDILGEEKFTKIVREGYSKRLDTYIEAHKKQTGLDKWDRDFKKIENYPKQLKESHDTIYQLSEQRKNVGDQLEKFLLSPDGRPVLEQLVKQSTADEFWRSVYQNTNEYRVNKSEEQKKLDAEIEKIPGTINANAAYYAQFHGQRFLKQLENLANDYVNNNSPSRDKKPEAILSNLSGKTDSVESSLTYKQYEKLPDLQTLQTGLTEVGEFYKRILEKLQNPQSLSKIATAAQAAEGFLYKNTSGGGLKTELEQPYMNPYWGEQIAHDDYQETQAAIKDFTALMPKYDAKKIKVVTFETPDFNKKYEYVFKNNGSEYIRDKAKQELDDLVKYTETLRPIVEQKADYDIARAEITAFEHSSKLPEVKALADIKHRQESIQALLPEIIALQQALEAKRPISLQENNSSYDQTINITDLETEELKKEVKKQSEEVTKKETDLKNLETEGRPGMFSGKRGAWDSAIAKLKSEIPQLQSELQKSKKSLENLRSAQENCVKLAQLLTGIRKGLPEDYKNLNLNNINNVGQIYEKLSKLTEEISALEINSDQRDFSRDYDSLKSKANKLKTNLEGLVGKVGLQKSF